MQKGIKKRSIRVLIGNIEPNFDHMLSMIIKKRLGGKFDPTVLTAGYGDELLKLAEKHPFGIFVLIPNNIMFPRENLTCKERGEKVLEIISHLRATYGKPIIAMSAFWTKDTSFAKKAKLAGVSYYLDMPFKPEEFLGPFRRLLEIEPENGSDGCGPAMKRSKRSKVISIRPDIAKIRRKPRPVDDKIRLDKEGIEALEKAIRFKPDDAKAHFNLGMAYNDIGRFPEAIEAFRQAICIKPDYAEAHCILGGVYFILEDRCSALLEYEILKDLDEDLAEELFGWIQGVDTTG